MITKISRAEIRTTLVNGIVPGVSIELGKLMYVNRGPVSGTDRLTADRGRLRLLRRLLLGFFVGGVAGAAGFQHLGYVATVPLALVLVGLSAVPIVDDLRARAR